MERFDLQTLYQFWLDYQQEIVWVGLALGGLVLLWALYKIFFCPSCKLPPAEEDTSSVERVAPTTPEPVSEEPEGLEKGLDKRMDEGQEEIPAPPVKEEISLTQRFIRGLSKTRQNFSQLFVVGQAVDEALLEELETHLLMADVGMDVTQRVLAQLQTEVRENKLAEPDDLRQVLQRILLEIVQPSEQSLTFGAVDGPQVILVVGVNGVGKTTTIGKLTKKIQAEGKKVMLAAGDTFRAAAVEQLQVWGERNNVHVVAQHTGADSASVIFDAVQSAQARGVDVVIADTAGRLHNKDNLMEELKKVTRVIKKLDETAPHEVLLVLDAGTGQNAISQMRQFQNAVGVTGVALTKLDGTAKGGVIFPLCDQFKVPVRFVGIGEGVDDLQPFVASEFVAALFGKDKVNSKAA